MYRNPNQKVCKIKVLTHDLDFLLNKLAEKDEEITRLSEQLEALQATLIEPKRSIMLNGVKTS